MDYFDDIIATFLESEGNLVRRNQRVDLTAEKKRTIGTPTKPGLEIDLLALNLAKREIILVEAKSFLDSVGVKVKTCANSTT